MVQPAPMLSSPFGKFQPQNMSFMVYVERFDLFLVATSKLGERKVLLFLTVLCGNTYDLLHNLLAPESPKDQTYESIVACLKAHFVLKLLIVAHRLHFHRRNQNADASITDYVAELHHLHSRCTFNGDHLQEALGDRLVCGLRSKSMLKRNL